MEVKIEQSWKEQLQSEFSKSYFKELVAFVKEEYNAYPDQIFPSGNNIFRAFDECPFDRVRAVILGQDPYPTRGHAHGLCFSVEPNVKPLPKSSSTRSPPSALMIVDAAPSPISERPALMSRSPFAAKSSLPTMLRL